MCVVVADAARTAQGSFGTMVSTTATLSWRKACAKLLANCKTASYCCGERLVGFGRGGLEVCCHELAAALPNRGRLPLLSERWRKDRA